METLRHAQNVRLEDPAWTDTKTGRVMPLFELLEESPEEWNRLARRLFLRAYVAQYGKEPLDFEAAYAAHQEEAAAARRQLPEVCLYGA